MAGYQKNSSDWEEFWRRENRRIIWTQRKQKMLRWGAILLIVALTLACGQLWSAFVDSRWAIP